MLVLHRVKDGLVTLGNGTVLVGIEHTEEEEEEGEGEGEEGGRRGKEEEKEKEGEGEEEGEGEGEGEANTSTAASHTTAKETQLPHYMYSSTVFTILHHNAQVTHTQYCSNVDPL